VKELLYSFLIDVPAFASLTIQPVIEAKDPFNRSPSSDWIDLCSADLPFKTIVQTRAIHHETAA